MQSATIISRYRALTYDNGNMLLYHKGKLYFEKESKTEFLCYLPYSFIRKLACKNRLLERLMRLEPRVACCLDEFQYLISCAGHIYKIDLHNNTLSDELQLRDGMNNPLSFTRVSTDDGSTERVLFGEYFSNNKLDPVSIFERANDGWKILYTFDAGTVYHIHGIVQDSQKKLIYVLTGDSDSESGIWVTDDYFRTLNPIIIGTQQYRACVAFAYKNGLLYATDTPREQNYLYYLYPQNGKWGIECVFKMPGPCIYGAKRNGRLLFATSVEGDDTLPNWPHCFQCNP